MSLRDRLRAKSLPSTEFRLRISDDSAARAELGEARRELKLAETRKQATAKAKVAVTKAEQKVDGCFETLTVKAIAPAELEALIAGHPAKGDDEAWNTETFRPALLAACIEGDMTVEDWAAFCQGDGFGVNLGEVRDLFHTALKINDRSPDDAVGKGWAQILNSL